MKEFEVFKLWDEAVTYSKSLRTTAPKFTILKKSMLVDAQKYYCAAMESRQG
jgi:hypothetical protein